MVLTGLQCRTVATVKVSKCQTTLLIVIGQLRPHLGSGTATGKTHIPAPARNCLFAIPPAHQLLSRPPAQPSHRLLLPPNLIWYRTMISKERTSDLLGPALCMATAPTVMVVSAMLPCLAFIAFAISMTVCMETRILGFLGQMAPTLDSNSEVSIKSEVFASLVTLEENRTNIPTDITIKSLLKSAQQRRLLTLLPLLGQAWDRSQDRHTVDFASNSRQTFLRVPYESFRALQEVALTSWKYSPQGHQLRVLRYPQRLFQQQHHRRHNSGLKVLESAMLRVQTKFRTSHFLGNSARPLVKGIPTVLAFGILISRALLITLGRYDAFKREGVVVATNKKNK